MTDTAPSAGRLACLCLALATALAACGDPLKPLAGVDEARTAVKQRFGDDWNITLPIVEKSAAGELICGYMEPPHPPRPGATPPLSDEHLFLYADHRLILPTDMGRKAFSDRVDKACPGLPRVKIVAPPQFPGFPR
jgi:hypothetical protein